MNRIINAKMLGRELAFTASRSDGPGGQNVNKVNSKVTLKFDVLQSEVLTEEEKRTIVRKLASRLTKEGVLLLNAQESRSQLQNKEAVLAKFDELVNKAFIKQKARRPTKPSRHDAERRMNQKKLRGEKKKWRQKPI